MATGATAESRSPDSQSQAARSGQVDNSSPKHPDIETGIFDAQKSRYTGASAATAFPHILGVALGSDSPPKINSIPYNFGTRPEETPNACGFLGKLISEDELAFYSNVYFSAMGSIGDLMDPNIYAQRCRDYCHSSGKNAVAFSAVAAGVAAFGSFLSTTKYSRESDLLQYAKAILDDPESIRTLCIDHIVAWGMRLFYLRATTRPAHAWLTSCTIMHLCEVVGLHKEENIKRMASVAGAAGVGHDVDRLRRIFWIAWAGHQMLSYEYDRSAVTFGAVTCEAITPRLGSVAEQFVQIVQIIPSPNSPFQLESQHLTPKEELVQRLMALSKLQPTHPFLVVTKAELAFCFYRRIYQLNTGMPNEIIQPVIDCGNAAIEAVEQMANHGPLWNVIGSIFQYICVLLAIDTSASSIHIPAALKALENLVRETNTALTRQALSIAQHLFSLNVAKKRNDLMRLEAVEAGFESFQAQPGPEPPANAAFSDLDWGLDWDQLLAEPYLSIFGPEIQLQ